MADAAQRKLSLAEWLVLCLIREEPTYGLVLAGLLARDGSLGRIWSVPKAAVYRALQRLELLGLIRTVEEQRTSQGPVRSLCETTPAGRLAAQAWLSTPVEHARDVRSELMVKLALLDRSGADVRELVQAQLAHLLPVAAALDERLRATTGFEHTLVLWRHEAMAAAMRFLQAVLPGQAEHRVAEGCCWDMVEERFAELIAGQRQGVLVTLRKDGWPQLSNVNYGWDPAEQTIRVSTTDDRAKTRNMRRDPRVSFHVTSGDFWSYVVVDGQAELSAVARDPYDAAVEELIDLYRAVQGEHPDWDDYRAAMVRDRRLVVRIRAERAYGMVHR